MARRDLEQPMQRDGQTVRRRGILAAAGAVMAGILAKQTASPVGAAAPLQYADTVGVVTNTAQSETILKAAAGSTPTILFAVDAGPAKGLCDAIDAYASGDGYGVYGYSPRSYGVYGSTAAAAGSLISGVYGTANGSNTFGVLGEGMGAGIGVQGQDGAIGVSGTVYAPSAIGVSGLSTGAGGYGVQGSSTLSHGVVGYSGTGAGASGVVAVGTAPGAVGFQGVAQGGATYAGYFFGAVSIQGSLGVTGSKFAVVKGADGKYRGMYAVESPECWFEDVGRATLINGAATVSLDPLFAHHIAADDYHVFLTAYGDTNGLFVASQSPTGFMVQERNAGQSTVAFSWRVLGKRSDIKDERLPVWEVPPGANIPSQPKLPTSAPLPPAPPPRSASPPAQLPQGTTPRSPVQPAPPPRP